MNGRMMLLLLLILLVLPSNKYAAEIEHWKKLDEIADEALQMVKSERYDDTKSLLEHFTKEFLQFSTSDKPYTMDELRVITITHNNAVEAVTKTALSHEERVRKVVQFRLVIDAIISEHQPLWVEMEHSTMKYFHQMKGAIEQDDTETFQYMLNLFLNKYEVIQPSIKVDVNPEWVTRVDSHIRFLESYQHISLEKAKQIQQLDQMESDLYELFNAVKDDDTDPSLLWVMISIGSVILLSLSYAGWKKYRADKVKQQSRKKLND
ncbi:sporulation protein YpjB [Cytobacillus sp. IB215316]|uniref:sporulation protein YpjB n=1 Tax=Cytobacillus sp. IB215316 TaxID=3097354 RepID=UPI002A185BE2|nr:sporulation protein YpjB [Cytobacillus sp. IB215316]MDX8361858.1 sporulation protein YpjB [Cytobacillus sp. IB215316]